jgi:hypothetical protein
VDNYLISNDYKQLMYYTHGTLHNFYLSFKDWMGNMLGIQSKDIFMGGYSKGAERVRNIINNDKLKVESIDGILNIDPTGEINMEETMGKELWRYPNVITNKSKYYNLSELLYKDDNIEMTIIFNRITADINCTLFLGSLSKYLDYRMYLLQLFRGGNDRSFKPYTFINNMIFEDNFIEASYYNEITKKIEQLHWDDTTLLNKKLIKQLGESKYVYPILAEPLIKMSSVNDSSNNKNVGQDLDTYMLNWTINYELTIPSYLFVNTEYDIEEIHQTIINSKYSYVNELPNHIEGLPDFTTDKDGITYKLYKKFVIEIDQHDETSNTIIFDLGDEMDNIKNMDFKFITHNNVYYYPSEMIDFKESNKIIIHKKYIKEELQFLNFGIYIKNRGE